MKQRKKCPYQEKFVVPIRSFPLHRMYLRDGAATETLGVVEHVNEMNEINNYKEETPGGRKLGKKDSKLKVQEISGYTLSHSLGMVLDQ